MSEVVKDSALDEPQFAKRRDHSQMEANENEPLTLLIVEDDLVNRIVLKGMLNKYGFDVLLADNGKQAVELFEEENPALILMDIMMPEMDGYNAAETIKKISEDNYIPILFLTAVTDEDAMVKCIESGGDDFLSKPYSPVILKTRIEALLRTRDLYEAKQKQNEKLNLREEEAVLDLNIAERILSKISREEAFDVTNINYHLSPMEQLNGDVIFVAHKPTGGQIYLLGDFTGHGLGAAIGGLVVFDVFKTMAVKGFSMTQIIVEINRKLKELLPTSRFLAGGIIELDAGHTTASIWNGGLPDIYLRSQTTAEIRCFPSIDIPLGILDNDKLDLNIVKTPINHGDQIFLYSDGVIEAENRAGEFFGEDRLKASIDAETEPQKVFDNILMNVSKFCEDSPQSDDVSILEIICIPSLTNQKGDVVVSRIILPATHWNLDFNINIDTIKQVDIVPSLVQLIVDIQGLHHYQKPLYLIITELYSNALEHGLLDLEPKMKESFSGYEQYYIERENMLSSIDKGSIGLNLRHEPLEKGGRLSLRISHDGDGFDIASNTALADPPTKNNSIGHKSGIRLVESLVNRLDYEDFGRVVEVDYIWGQD